jgi:hypothetical protein
MLGLLHVDDTFFWRASDAESDVSRRASAQQQACPNAPFAVHQATLRFHKINPSLRDAQERFKSRPSLP